MNLRGSALRGKAGLLIAEGSGAHLHDLSDECARWISGILACVEDLLAVDFPEGAGSERLGFSVAWRSTGEVEHIFIL